MTGSTPPKCYLQEFSDCEGKLSAEHYVSRALLKLLFDGGKGVVHGTPWSPHEPTKVAINSLTARILCQGHNSQLSLLDTVGASFFSAIQKADQALASGAGGNVEKSIRGDHLERWMLKAVCGMLASGNFADKGTKIVGPIPANWQKMLVSGVTPYRWGLYLKTQNDPFEFTQKEFQMVPLSGTDGIVRATAFSFGGVQFNLVLGVPDAAVWGFYRPSAITLEKGQLMHRINLEWPMGAQSGVVGFTRIN